jgi:hypothetical protein
MVELCSSEMTWANLMSLSYQVHFRGLRLFGLQGLPDLVDDDGREVVQPLTDRVEHDLSEDRFLFFIYFKF